MTTETVEQAIDMKCEWESACQRPVTMIARKGYILCDWHGGDRGTRKLRPFEMRRLERGLTVQKY